jgi:hypothetical protein
MANACRHQNNGKLPTLNHPSGWIGGRRSTSPGCKRAKPLFKFDE